MFGNSYSIRGFLACLSVLIVAVFIQTSLANDGKSGGQWEFFCEYFNKYWIFNSEYEDVKMKRGGNVGLFPFPRVGRADPELPANWEPLLSSLDDYNGNESRKKNAKDIEFLKRCLFLRFTRFLPHWDQTPRIDSVSSGRSFGLQSRVVSEPCQWPSPEAQCLNQIFGTWREPEICIVFSANSTAIWFNIDTYYMI